MRALHALSTWPVEAASAGVLVRQPGPPGHPPAVRVRATFGEVDRPYAWASITKLCTALAVLVAVEEGTVAVDLEAGPPGATVAHLLSHASGLAADGGVVAPPGRRRIYSNAGFEVLAATVAARSDMVFAEYLAEAVLEPLHMATRLEPAGSAAHGLDGSLADLLALGTELLSPVLLAPETAAAATTVVFPGLAGVLPGFGHQDPCDWGLGFELKDAKRPHWTGAANSPATFGHFGRSGGFLWVDPVAGVACGVLTDRQFGDWSVEAWPSLADAVLAELGHPVTDGAPLRVALDATPLIGRPTGIGAFCAGLLEGLAGRPEVAPCAFAVSWRRRHAISGRLPPGVRTVTRAMPARPLHAAWKVAGFPPIEWFCGRQDVVHGTNYVVPPTARAARVVSVHDLTVVRFPELCDGATLAYPHLVRRALAGGAWVHTDSTFVAAEVVELLGADPDRVRTVHPGIPPLPPPDPAAAARLVPPGTGRYILAVGTVEPRKDLPGLVAAFDRLTLDHPDVALVLAGPRGWGSGALADALGRSPAAGRVVTTGWVDDATLSGLLVGAAVLAYPSVYEGFGFPPLQAMAAGTPVVATRAGSLEEVLGAAASLVAPGDPDALAGALAKVLDTAAHAAHLAEGGRAHAAGYRWETCAEGMEGLYRDALAAGPAKAARR